MLTKESSKTITNDEHSKENTRLSIGSKISSLKYGEDAESQFNLMAHRNSLQETESNLNPKFTNGSEPTTLTHFQTKASGFSGAPTSPRKLPQIIQNLDDAQAILSKIDKPQEIIKAFDTYQPKNKDIDLSSLRKSEKTKIKKYKTSVFLGEFLNGKRHGKGIMISAPMKIYEGDWENDIKHGKGLEILEKGSRYEGEYSNGKPEGYGTFLWENGEIYEGEWKNGLKHGSGMWKGTKGESYLGEWKYGKAEGHGVHTWRNGDKYEGEFKGFLKHGHGTEKFMNGDYYIGNYANGKPDGFGEYYWSNGCHYKGDFKNGLRHGKGSWRKGTGDFYEGEWANDKKNGLGVYQWVSGNRYLGSYFDDIRHGYGEMFWIDGSSYKGFWEKGVQHGEGQIIMPGKAHKRGIFDKNILIDEMNIGGIDHDLFNNTEGSPMSNNQYTNILGTPRRYVQSKPPKKISKLNDYNPSIDPYKNGEICLPEIKSVKAVSNSVSVQSKQNRKNSSSIGPRTAISKLEAHYGTYKPIEQPGIRKVQNLNIMSINDHMRKMNSIVKAK